MFKPDSLIAAYPEFDQRSQGGTRFPIYPVINDAATALTTQPTGGYSPLRLGQSLVDDNGFFYLYVRADAALAAGQVVTLGDVASGAVDTANATGDNIHVIRTTITAGTAANSEVGNFLALQNSTGSLTVIKKILANTGGANSYVTISQKEFFIGRGGYDGDALSAAFTVAGSTAQIIRPYHVKVGIQATLPFGIALGTVTSGNNTLVQITGLAMVLGKAADTFANDAFVYTGAAGVVTVTSTSAYVVGVSKSTYAGANSVTGPVWLTGIYCNW